MQRAGLNPSSSLLIGPLKDPIRVFEKGHNDYSERWDPDVTPNAFTDDTHVPPTACVVDILRSRVICDTAEQMMNLIKELSASRRDAKFEVARMKNKFNRAKMDPTHFRNILVTLKIWNGSGLFTFAEMQIHHRAIYETNEKKDADGHNAHTYCESRAS